MTLAERIGLELRVFSASMALAAITMILVASFLPWGSLEVETKLGTFPVSLSADVYEYGIDYEANLTGAGLFSNARVPTKMADKKVFLTGLGGFQETIGFVKGTTKEKNWTIQTWTWPPPQYGTADCNVITFVKTIPWWPVGLAQDAGVTIELKNATRTSEVIVQKVWFEVHRTVNGEDQFKNVSGISPGESLKNVGDRRTYTVKITMDEDIGEFRLVGRVLLELKDIYGNSNKDKDNTQLAEPRDIRLWTMGTDKTVRLGMMVAAFPLSLASVVLLAIGAVLGSLGGSRARAARWAWKLCLAGFVAALLAVLFYVSGIGALIELTGYTDWFRWTSQFYIAVAGVCLAAVPGILLFAVRPPPAPGKQAGQGGTTGKTAEKGAPAERAARKEARAPSAGPPAGPPEPTNKVNR